MLLFSLFLGMFHLTNAFHIYKREVTIDLSQHVPFASSPPAYFTGFNIEWPQLKKAFLKNEASMTLNVDYIKSLLAITAPRNSSIVLRIGGNSATYMWYLPSKLARLPQQTPQYDISDVEFKLLNQLGNVYGMKFVLNLGMTTPKPTFAHEILKAWTAFIDSLHILAIEVGNEPDHLFKRGLRSTSYSAQDFFKEYDDYVQVIRQYYPNVDLMGPGYAYGWRDEGHHIPFIEQKSNSTRYFSFHRYQLRGCAQSNTLDMLLDSPRTINGNSEYQWTLDFTNVIQKQGADKVNVWGEGGSASCGGNPEISDSFGSGLWALDMLFEMTYRGVGLAILSGLPAAEYSPVWLKNGVITGAPTGLGMHLYNVALGNSPSFIYIPNGAGLSVRLRAWAIKSEKSYTLVVINKQNQPNSISVSVPLPNAQSRMIIMKAESVSSLSGFTTAGMTLGPNGFSGTYQETMLNVENGRAIVNIPSASAIILRFSQNFNGPFF